MSNYTKLVNFAVKDTLDSGDSQKVVQGQEIDTEYNNIQLAIETKADANNAQLDGSPVTDTAAPLTATRRLATTQYVMLQNGVTTADLTTLITTTQSTATTALTTLITTAQTAATTAGTTADNAVERAGDTMAGDLAFGSNAVTFNSKATGSGFKIIEETAAGVTKLFFEYNGTKVAMLDSTGAFTVKGDVTAFGTIA